MEDDKTAASCVQRLRAAGRRSFAWRQSIGGSIHPVLPTPDVSTAATHGFALSQANAALFAAGGISVGTHLPAQRATSLPSCHPVLLLHGAAERHPADPAAVWEELRNALKHLDF